jgi:hypothetical protein
MQGRARRHRLLLTPTRNRFTILPLARTEPPTHGTFVTPVTTPRRALLRGLIIPATVAVKTEVGGEAPCLPLTQLSSWHYLLFCPHLHWVCNLRLVFCSCDRCHATFLYVYFRRNSGGVCTRTHPISGCRPLQRPCHQARHCSPPERQSHNSPIFRYCCIHLRGEHVGHGGEMSLK